MSSLNHQEDLKQAIVVELKSQLPQLVADQVGLQIQELVWDKIKLNKKLNNATQNMNDPMVLKVGEYVIKKQEFIKRFQEYQSRPEIAKLNRSEQKKKFLEQLHKHYAILEDSRNSSLENNADFIEKLENFKFKVFLTELLRQQIKSIDISDIKSYYETNKSLFELDEVHSFEFVESDQAATLQEINNLQKFEQSSLSKKKFDNRAESKIPIQFVKALRPISVNQLTAVVPFEGRYFLIKKNSESQKVYSPVKTVAPLIQSTITYQRIRMLLSKLSNPLKFEFDVELSNEGTYQIRKESVTQRYLSLARTVLPKDFFLKAQENKGELRDLAMEFDLLFRKFKQNPNQYSSDIVKEVKMKSELYTEQLVVEFKQKDLFSQAVVDEQDLKSYYEIHKEKFVKSVGRWVSHIFVMDRSKALKVLNLTLDDPKGFAQLAKEHSEHSATRSYGGDMRYLDKSEVTQQMHNIAETLRQGEVHPELIPGVNGRGYHILKYVKTVPGEISSFLDVKERLYQLILREQQGKLLTNFVREVMVKYPPKVDNTILAQL